MVIRVSIETAKQYASGYETKARVEYKDTLVEAYSYFFMACSRAMVAVNEDDSDIDVCLYVGDELERYVHFASHGLVWYK